MSKTTRGGDGKVSDGGDATSPAAHLSGGSNSADSKAPKDNTTLDSDHDIPEAEVIASLSELVQPVQDCRRLISGSLFCEVLAHPSRLPAALDAVLVSTCGARVEGSSVPKLQPCESDSLCD